MKAVSNRLRLLPWTAIAVAAAAAATAAAAEGVTESSAQAATTPTNGALLVSHGTSPGFAIVNPDGTGLGSLIPTGGGFNQGDLLGEQQVSPDGTHLAFWDRSTGTIWVCNVDGSNAHQVSFPGQAAIGGPAQQQLDFRPVWADDSTILFARGTNIYNAAGTAIVDSNAEIMATGINGTGERVWLADTGNTKQAPISRSNTGLLLYFDSTGGFAYKITDIATHTQTRPLQIPNVAVDNSLYAAALSPDGTRILVDTDIDTRVYNLDGTGEIPVGTKPNASALAWSPDSTRVAYTGGDPGVTPALRVTDATPGAPITTLPVLSGYYGTAWLPGTPVTPPPTPPTSTTPTPTPTPGAVGPKVYRDAGSDRIGTGIAISQQRWASTGSAKAVVLATSLNFPDALSGGPLAAKKNGPLLLTDGSATKLDPRVLAEIQRVLPSRGAVHVLGGDGAMNPAIVTQLKSLGYAVTQYKGRDRADTALRVARDGMGSPQHVVLATGAGFADALAAGPYAAGPFADSPGAPAAIVLSDGAHLDPTTAAFLNGKTVATVGAQAGHAWPGATKTFPGLDRFDTAARVAREFTGAFANTQVGIANGIASATNPGYPDALTGGAFMAESNGPIVLVDGIAGVVPPDSQGVLTGRTGNGRADIFGGTSVISPGLAASIVSLLHGTAQF